MIHCSGQHVLSSSSCCSNWSLFVLFVLIDRSDGRKVVLGAHSLSEPEDSKQTFNIVEVFSHPDFCTSNYDNDIALVKVSHIPVFSLSVSVSGSLLCVSPLLLSGQFNPNPTVYGLKTSLWFCLHFGTLLQSLCTTFDHFDSFFWSEVVHCVGSRVPSWDITNTFSCLWAKKNLLCDWQLDRPIVASDAVKSLKFQRDQGADPDTDQEVNTAGWGSLNNLGSRPDKLQELVIAVMNRVRCGRSDYYGKKFTKNMLCAASTRSDTCDVSLPHNISVK